MRDTKGVEGWREVRGERKGSGLLCVDSKVTDTGVLFVLSIKFVCWEVCRESDV